MTVPEIGLHMIHRICGAIWMARFPPLTSLRAFEAAARHLSFTRAAEELRLTHSAISHQIRGLEQYVGVTLFVRRPRGVALTQEGQILAVALQQAFARVDSALAHVKARRSEVLTLSVLPAFAARWLVPRLSDFQNRHPEIQINLTPSAQLANLRNDGVDAAIRFGAGHWPNVKADKIKSEILFPVASPKFRDPLPAHPHDLLGHTLLNDGNTTWEPWLNAAGLGMHQMRFGATYGDAGLLLEAAAQGHGIALARATLAECDIGAGRLVRLFDTAVECEFAYYFVCLPVREHEFKIQAFRTWLVDQIAESIARRPQPRIVGRHRPIVLRVPDEQSFPRP
jgi:LysR family glycine cleavage system transcriptional activator